MLQPVLASLLPNLENLPGIYAADLSAFPEIVFFFIFLLGGCFGSFANAAAMRLVRDESPVLPPSRCRFCDTPLRWHDNLPLLGWVLLRGKSACCQKQIPMRYILVEWGFAGLTLWLAMALPLAVFAALMVINIIMMIALLTDSEAMVLHPLSLLIGAIIGVTYALFIDSWPTNVTDSVAGVICGGGVIFIVNLIYRLMRGINGFGSGDIWLLAMIGAIFGLIPTIIIFFASAMLGAVVGCTLILAGKAASSSKLPFGLFLSVVFLLYPALNMLLI